MLPILKINAKYIFNKNYQAHKLFKDILYIPSARDRELIDHTDDLQLPSNNNRRFTWVII